METADKLSRRIVLDNILTGFSGSIVAQGMTALSLLLTARKLDVDGYGQYAACISFASLSAILFSLGLDLWLLREGGRNRSKLSAYVGSVLTIKAIFGLGWVMAFFLFVPLLNQETYPATLLRWSVILVWLDNLLVTLQFAFKAALQSRIPSILEAGADIIWFVLTLGLIGMGVTQPVTYMMIRIPVSIGALVLGWVLFWRINGLSFEVRILRVALRSSLPFAVSDFLAMIMMRADVVIVGLILGKTATGLYSPAVGLVHLGFLAPMAVYMVVVPVLSNLFRNHPHQARRTSVRTILLTFGLGICLAIGFGLGAPLVVKLLGESFKGSIDILRILSMVLFFKSGSYGMAAIIVATDQQAKRALVQTIAALINLGGNFLVVHWIGIRGVAGIYVLTELILLVGYSWLVWRKLWMRK